MSINMADVKQIINNANNKEVVKIEDGLGNVLWQKVSEQPYRRLEYLIFDGTCYCASAEHNADNRAYRLDFMQTGWADNNKCYPFGIWTSTSPQNILLIRNEASNTTRGFEICRVGSISGFGIYPASTYLNSRIVAEMRWGTDKTVNYRLRDQSSSSYIEQGFGTASGRTGTDTGNFFIGAINDGGGGTYSNANGLLVGRIYEVAIAGSNSFDDYGYAYVPCQRKSDGAIGFKQPHADNFYPLLNKSDGSVVTNVTAHMGPVVDDNWDGVTYTIIPSPTSTDRWYTIYTASGTIGYLLREWCNKKWSSTGVPCDIGSNVTKLRITYKHYYNNGSSVPSGKYAKLVWGNGGTNPVIVTPDNNTETTITFDYTQGHDIVYGTYSTSNNYFSTARNIVSWSWYQNGTQGGSGGSDWTSSNRTSRVHIYKVEAYIEDM